MDTLPFANFSHIGFAYRLSYSHFVPLGERDMPKAANKKRNGAAHGSSPYSHAGKSSAANHIFKMKTVCPYPDS